MSSPALDIVQVAYFVDDVKLAAQRMADTFSAGPFFVVERIPLNWGKHRGEECNFVHTSAYGQWGNVMMELVQQDEEGPSPFRDLYAPGESGLHHVAVMVDDQQQAYIDFAAKGFPVATVAETTTGTEFAFLDALDSLGHFIEIYAKSEGLLGFYAQIKQASVGWRGSNPVRPVNQLGLS